MDWYSIRWDLALLQFFIMRLLTNVQGEAQVPCHFIFGDSYFDNGNNNALRTTIQANYPPYGIDFLNDQPTGRFSNGRNIVDIITELLGFKNYIPPFATARSPEILKGVNYASGGAGIRDESGRNLGEVISMNQQILNHQITVHEIGSLLGGNVSTADYLNKCIYTIGIGTNDYFNNYYLPRLFPTSRLYTPEQYATRLIQEYSQQLKNLYNQGVRKAALFGIGPIGCTPAKVAMYSTNNGSLCVDFINSAVQLFNTKLIALVDHINTHLLGAKFIYVNKYGISTTSITAFRVSNAPCCESRIENGVTCIPYGQTCSNRSEYAFWDLAHQTEAADMIIAQRSYDALLPNDTYPTDIRHLATDK